MVKFWKSEFLVFQPPFFVCMSWTKTTNAQYWAICGVSVEQKKIFFFLDIFRENWKFRQSPDFTRSQIWGLSCVPGSKPSSVLESWQNLLSSKVWVNPLLSTFRPSKLAPKFFLGFFPDFFSKKNFGAYFEGLNVPRSGLTHTLLESKFCQLSKTLLGFDPGT